MYIDFSGCWIGVGCNDDGFYLMGMFVFGVKVDKNFVFFFYWYWVFGLFWYCVVIG